MAALSDLQILGLALCAALTLGGLAWCAGQRWFGWDA